MGNYQIDEIDRKILSFLVKDARMAYLEIARECGVSGAAIHQRVRKLEAGGVITGSRLLVKPSAIGLNVLIKLYCFDNDHLMSVLLNTIQNIPYVQSTDTMISLDEAFERQVWVKDFNITGFR